MKLTEKNYYGSKASMVSLNCEDEYVDLVDAPLAILTKSITPISFDRISIDGSKLKISQRKFHTADECAQLKNSVWDLQSKHINMIDLVTKQNSIVAELQV